MIQDAGGVPLAGGTRMRSGLVYRISGALVDPAELDELNRAGLRTIVDLRHEREDRSGVMAWAASCGAEYFNFPISVGGWRDGGFEDVNRAMAEGRHVEWFRDAYGRLALDFGPQLAAAFESLSRGLPAGFGCAAGKDRTGVMGAYLHVLLGATEETAVRSYLEKAPPLDALRPQAERLYGLAPGEEISPALAHVMGVHAENMEHVFDAVRERGGVEGFLRGNGLSDAAVKRLRDALVEPLS